ncbi:sulfotransferase family protein [Kineosporia sp. NBRC 101731]|uniref:sulfotransferase family protein n=1 Tax=Kineosporia sp. NBRC 101731 TaxID=3032199 RepID=UPI0024A02895|nr:sulfotransferase family protein [Kineosporia sp. NBRC 101731]GLY30396.1 sulfotransferase family protein [Kineosporia sp. NBRC 101731]
MDVIGVGFGRTGTTTLKQALEILGLGPTYHTREIFQDPDRLAHWEAALAGDRDWDRVFEGYRSTVDWPGAAFWAELVEYYPDAKVILTVRDPRRWHRSSMRTIFLVYRRDLPSRLLVRLIRVPLRFADRRLRSFNETYDGIFRRHFADGPIHDEDYAVEVFEKHLAAVREAVPAERLLVYRVEEGWPTLCKFLGIGIPVRTFPHANDQWDFQRRSGGFVMKGMRRMIGRAARGLSPGGSGRTIREAPDAPGADLTR